MELTAQKCKPCERGTAPMATPEIMVYKEDIHEDWRVDINKISRDFVFQNYKETIDFVNEVAQLAENEGHHPVMHVYFSKITIELWTHAIEGLSENDFIMAAKIDELYSNL